MLDISLKSRNRFCDGMTRRDFVRIGALTPLGLALPSLLKAEGKGRKSRAKSVVLVYLGGGMSHHDTFDMKPEAPAEIRGNYKPISTSVPGLQISEKLPSLSRSMHKMTVVRSAAHNNDHHETATNWVMSGRFGSAFGDHPAIGAVVAHETGFTGTMPPYVSVPSNPGFTWELGKSRVPGRPLRVASSAGDPNNPSRTTRSKTFRPAVELSTRRSCNAARRCCKPSMASPSASRGTTRVATYDEFHQRATGDDPVAAQARRAFAIDSGAGEVARALRPHHVRPVLPCSRGGWSSRACATSPSTTAGGTTTARFSRG